MSRSVRPLRQRGVTLIELMVALLVGMILSLSVFVIMNTAEGRKRTTTSTSDVNQTGNYALFLLDQWIRNAGNGFTKSAAYSFGCKLKAYYGGTQILPTPNNAALPAPFDSVNIGSTTSTRGVFRLAPVLILPEQTTPGVSGSKSDVLVIMGGGAGAGGVPVPFTGAPTATQLKLSTTTALAANDLLLLTQVEPSTTANSNEDGAITSVNAADCIIEQLGSAATVTGALDGNYHSTDNGLSAFTDHATAMGLGNVTGGSVPQFQVIGVGDNNTLFSYDLLNTTGGATRSAVARADGVFELHALYGIDKNCDGKISSDEWVSPKDSTYSVAALMAGSMQEESNRPTNADTRLTACSTLTTANDYLQKILAIRVGLILRTSQPENNPVTLNAITLFSDLGDALTYTRTLKTKEDDADRQEQYYRYRTVELTIPLRNSLMLP